MKFGMFHYMMHFNWTWKDMYSKEVGFYFFNLPILKDFFPIPLKSKWRYVNYYRTQSEGPFRPFKPLGLKAIR